MAATDPAPMSRAVAVLYAIGSPLALVALVFVPAGRIDWLPGWVFRRRRDCGIRRLGRGVGVGQSCDLSHAQPLSARHREVGTWCWRKSSWQRRSWRFRLPRSTSGRMSWSAVPLWMVIFGYVLLVGGIAVTTWAQAVNPFFEPGVRIQHERRQRVVTSGPYAFVRHPGYTAAIAMFLGVAFALASWWALIPAALASGLLVLRTSWEDRLLQAELSGYTDYVRLMCGAFGSDLCRGYGDLHIAPSLGLT